MVEILTATVPVFLVIMLGSALAHRQVVGGDSWRHLQQLNYFLFIPAMFLAGITAADYTEAPVFRVVVATTLALGVGTAAVWLWRARRSGGLELGPQLLEAGIRANIPYGMGLSLALGGEAGLHLFLIAAATYLPSVVVAGGLFAQMAGRRNSDPEAEQQYALVSAFRLLATNPIIIGVIAGAALHLTSQPLAPGLATVFQTAGYAATPVGLLGAGAALSIAAAQNTLDGARGDVLTALALKLLALPVLGGLLTLLFGLGGVAAVAVILITALPCVVPRFTVGSGASQTLLTGVSTLATLLSAVTLPVALWALT